MITMAQVIKLIAQVYSIMKFKSQLSNNCATASNHYSCFSSTLNVLSFYYEI